MTATLTFNSALQSHDVYVGGRMVFSSQVLDEAVAVYRRLGGGSQGEQDAAEDCQTPRGPWGSCIRALALGWILGDDLCPVCTRQFMAALDGVAGPLKWHETFTARAAGTREGVDR